VKWRCADCGRVHDEPPARCACDSANVEPETDHDGGHSLLALRQRLLSPGDADRSLVREQPYVALLFRVLVGVAVLALVATVVLLLV